MQTEGKTGLTAAFLKGTALLSMLLDHVGYVLVVALWAYAARHPLPVSTQQIRSLYYALRCIGRPAFP
ncbi:MAG: hypothetical protein IJ594_07730, partial [Oscillospiraceae bacterium]|nr:hypothetical protein [Oscillospiraceae bacterium]